MSEPLLKPGEAVDYFDVWLALTYDAPMPNCVLLWASRSPSRQLYLEELNAIFEAQCEGPRKPISLDLAEMICRMICDINDISYQERQKPE